MFFSKEVQQQEKNNNFQKKYEVYKKFTQCVQIILRNKVIIKPWKYLYGY